MSILAFFYFFFLFFFSIDFINIIRGIPLLFRCSNSGQIWWEIQHKIGFQDITPHASMSLPDWRMHLRKRL
jgi:hypothetical protein